MENLEEIFRAEAIELIDDLEKSLFNLEKDPGSKGVVERIFRVMHTLKGNYNMFGYELMGDFTHSLETIYDLVRTNKIEISKNVLNITLEAVDHLRNVLKDSDLEQKSNKENHQRLLNEIHKITNEDRDKDIQENKIPVDTSGEKGDVTTYLIQFHPDPGILRNQVNPLYLLDELNSLGNCVTYARTKKIPSIEKIDPHECYLSWDILLGTSEDISKIQDVFIFVQNDAYLDIHKLAGGNLLANDEFTARINNTFKKNDSFSLTEIKHLVTDFHQNTLESSSGTTSKQATKKDTGLSSIRVSSEKLDDLMNLVSELVTVQARLSLYSEQKMDPALTSIAENVEKISRRLRDNTFNICLIPIENLLTRFKRLVRDLSNELEKEIDFVAEGTDTELDKSIIESLADPIMHILRNAIDHGIEDADTRLKLGKSKKGKILFKSFYSGTNVIIQIKDDGKGLNVNKIKQKAIKQGLIKEDAELSTKEIFDLLFLPGFSTAKKVTGISGRGVGMDVVKRKIGEIRGEVSIESIENEGTCLSLKIPLTMSVIDGLLVRIYDTHFVIPLGVVGKCYEMLSSRVIGKFNNWIAFDGKNIPFINLREAFHITNQIPEVIQMVQVNYEDVAVGLLVDEIIGEYQAVLKPLGKIYKNIDIVSGATILGDGTIALVLDTNKIIKNFADLKEPEESII